MMVSIQGVKERNDMSKELRNHGFAVDSQDAIHQAEQIYDTNSDGPDVSFDEGTNSDDARNRVDNEIAEIKRRLNVVEQESDDADDAQYDELVHKINEIVQAINDLEDRQDQLEAQLNGKSESETEPVQQQSEHVQEDSEPVQDPQPGQDASQSESTDENPATGEYEPDDVAVEKIFYSGDS